MLAYVVTKIVYAEDTVERPVDIFVVFQMIKGKVKAGKVDCQAYPQTCQRAGIKAYPSVKFYRYEKSKVCPCFSRPAPLLSSVSLHL